MSREGGRQKYRHRQHHHPMLGMATALARLVPGPALWLWTCLCAEAQRGGGGYSLPMERSPDVRAEVLSVSFLESHNVGFGRQDACRG